MCALVMKSPATAAITAPKTEWTRKDRLRWRVECFFQKLRGEV